MCFFLPFYPYQSLSNPHPHLEIIKLKSNNIFFRVGGLLGCGPIQVTSRAGSKTEAKPSQPCWSCLGQVGGCNLCFAEAGSPAPPHPPQAVWASRTQVGDWGCWLRHTAAFCCSFRTGGAIVIHTQNDNSQVWYPSPAGAWPGLDCFPACLPGWLAGRLLSTGLFVWGNGRNNQSLLKRVLIIIKMFLFWLFADSVLTLTASDKT